MPVSALVKVFAGISIAVIILSFGWWASSVGLPAELPESTALREWFNGLGVWGPVAVIGTMAAAILVSPLPSAPIALAAGAIYGHYWGTLYVLAGSEIGAISAFGIARFLGHDLIDKWFGTQLNQGLAGSQNFLMLSVFASRLMPFISFDIVSYAAGLTALTFWRFALATLAGIIPASFLLAHFGSQMVSEEMDRIVLAIVLLGLITAVPLVMRMISKFNQK